MADFSQTYPFRHELSLLPLVEFWRTTAAPACPGMACALGMIEGRLAETPELLKPIRDKQLLRDHADMLGALMSVAFPLAFWETKPMAAISPLVMEVIHCNPAFEKLVEQAGGPARLKDPVRECQGDLRPLKAYHMILERFYGMKVGRSYNDTRTYKNPATGLDRYFRLEPHFQFLEIRAEEPLQQLDDRQRQYVLENVANPARLKELLPPEKFLFSGLVLVSATDVTDSEVLSELERELIGAGTVLNRRGFLSLQKLLATYLGRPELLLGLAALRGDTVVLINNGCENTEFFADSRSKDAMNFEGSIFHQAVESREVRYISDLAALPIMTPIEKDLLEGGVRSQVIVPLVYENEVIGTLDIASDKPGYFNGLDGAQIAQLAPLFAMAVNKSLAEMDTQVQGIIKQKCTAVHPSVEWRFQEAAHRHLDRLRSGAPSEMEPIVFKDVYPLYATSDIRSSSDLRSGAVSLDLEEHLRLALEVLKWSAEQRDWPVLGELSHRLDQQLTQVKGGAASGLESTVSLFVQQEVEPVFSHLKDLGPRVTNALENYRAAVDPELGTVYRQRALFEKSVGRLNDSLGAYLDREETAAQAMFPHYFEKHQTDGLDYMIYIGAAMAENRRFDEFHVRNLRLWQMQVACGVAAITEQLKAELPVPLDTAHLILVQHSPLSIRFRYDEKRFDVDGAYDVRHEIIKSRLDKSQVAGSGERLTQPGMLSVVYSNPIEGREVRRYLNYLISTGMLTGPVESLNLADMPGVKGLKALRAAMDLNAAVLSQRLERVSG